MVLQHNGLQWYLMYDSNTANLCIIASGSLGAPVICSRMNEICLKIKVLLGLFQAFRGIIEKRDFGIAAFQQVDTPGKFDIAPEK